MNRKEQFWAYQSLFLLLCHILGVLLNLDDRQETIEQFNRERDMHEIFMQRSENE